MIDSLRPGGAEQLLPALLSHFDRGQYETRVCVLQVKNGNPIANDLNDLEILVDLVLIPNLKNPFYLIRVLRYLKSQSPDLIHTQLEFADILGNIAAKFLRIPSVSTLHTLEEIRNYKFSAPRQRLKWFVLKRFCDRVIAVSEITRHHHIQLGKLPQDKIRTIYNGIQLSRFQDRDQGILGKIKREIGLKSNDKVITTVAVLREPKGIQYMIEALPAILERQPNLIYLIVGDGDYAATLQNLVADRRLQEHVIFTGYRTDIPNLLAISNIFVLPSLGDALPTVLIESLAAGTPIVATRVGGIPEIIEHDVNGWLVPPADSQSLSEACLELLQNSEKSQQLIANGLDTAARRFDVRTQVEQLQNLYTELLIQYGK